MYFIINGMVCWLKQWILNEMQSFEFEFQKTSFTMYEVLTLRIFFHIFIVNIIIARRSILW